MNRYIEHIINDLVRDTRINYDREEVHFPFYSRPLDCPLPLSPLPDSFYRSSRHFSPSPFSKYCKNTYGLTDQEVKYVWERYKDIILDKINE
jgi:hypothetical protein